MTRNTARFRWVVVSAVVTATLTGAASFHAAAQSEYMRGDRMPYDAFDKLPKTDVEISGGTIHTAFAPGNIAAGSLAGEYAGPTAQGTVGVGVGANVLLGGSSSNQFTLQPVSVEGSVGLNAAAGVAAVSLRKVP